MLLIHSSRAPVKTWSILSKLYNRIHLLKPTAQHKIVMKLLDEDFYIISRYDPTYHHFWIHHMNAQHTQQVQPINFLY